MIAGGHFRKWFFGDNPALAKDGDLAIRFEQERAFFTDYHGVIRADLRGRKAQRCE